MSPFPLLLHPPFRRWLLHESVHAQRSGDRTCSRWCCPCSPILHASRMTMLRFLSDLANRDYSFTLGWMDHCARWDCLLTGSLHLSTAYGTLSALSAAALSWFFIPSATGSSFLSLCSPAGRTTASTGEPARKVTCVSTASCLMLFLIFQGVSGHGGILGPDEERSETAVRKVGGFVCPASPLNCDQPLGCFIRQLDII